MSKRAIFLGWNRPIPGREGEAVELFSMSMNYWNKLKDNGTIESFEPFVMSAHGGDLNGCVVLRGEPEKLRKLQHDKEYLELDMKAAYLLDGYGAVMSYAGEGVMEWMTHYMEMVRK